MTPERRHHRSIVELHRIPDPGTQPFALGETYVHIGKWGSDITHLISVSYYVAGETITFIARECERPSIGHGVNRTRGVHAANDQCE
jgi:hypothetical protein